MHNFNIEKDVPIPSKFGQKAKWLALAMELEVGDSFVVPDAGVKETVRCCLKTYGIKLATRAIKDDDGLHITGYRIWCLDKPEAISYGK